MDRFDQWKGEWSATVGALRGALGAMTGKARLRKLAGLLRARAAISREGARRHVQVFEPGPPKDAADRPFSRH